MNVVVYLPSIALTLMLLVVIPLAFLQKWGTGVGIFATLATGIFAAWVAVQRRLIEYLPGLGMAVLAAGVLHLAALALFFTAAIRKQPLNRRRDLRWRGGSGQPVWRSGDGGARRLARS